MEKSKLVSPREVSIPTEKPQTQRKLHRLRKFTADMDDFLERGTDRHGYRQWTAILTDSDIKFQEGRTVDYTSKHSTPCNNAMPTLFRSKYSDLQ